MSILISVELLFGILRTMVGNDSNVDVLQLAICLTGTTEVSTILAKYPHWDRSPRRLKLPALSKDSFEVYNGIDHIKPPSWCGDVNVSRVNLQTSWRLGRETVEKDFPVLGKILTMIEDPSVNILAPMGIDLMRTHHNSEDDDTAEDFGQHQTPDADTAPAPEPDLEDAIAEETPSGKHNPCFDLDGDGVYKARYLNALFKDFTDPGSRDRLKRVACIPRYTVKQDQTDVVDHDSIDGAPSIRMDSPIAILLNCENHLFVCIGEVNDITFDSKHVDEISLETLTEPSVYVSYQVLCVVPATSEDDPTLRNDWRWSHRRLATHRVSGRLIEPINPSISIREIGNPAYLFESGVLMALGASILERLTSEEGKLLPEVVSSDDFPYREATGGFKSLQ